MSEKERRTDKKNKKGRGLSAVKNYFSKERAAARRESWRLFKQDMRDNLANSTTKQKVLAFTKLFLLLFIMIGIPVILFIYFKNTLFSDAYWSDLPSIIKAHRDVAFVALVFLQMLQILVCFIPGQPIQFASSYLYGLLGGYIISIIGAVIGSILTYYIAQFLGSNAMHLLFGEKRVKDYMNKLNSSKAYTMIFLIYLIPGIPKDLLSYVAGISDIRLRPFLMVSTVGRSPGIIESLLFGMFWADKNYVGLAIVAVITLTILIVCFVKKDSIMAMISSYEDEEAEKHHNHDKEKDPNQ
jgi:uncharacterized membrane protein YdjX (TVP38/TMEM64 family)